ncbi:MAG: hypothetical protein IKX76_04720 [Eubacterium sp.]|nr:hypothetical protein [Eubacterium sp.]
MNLELKGLRVNRCVFENKMGPNTKVNLKVDTRTQINIPKDFKKGSMGNVVTRIVVGSPLDALYLFLEQVATFADSDALPGVSEDQETMMSLFKTICVPVANRELENTVKQLCAAYRIPEIKLQRNPKVSTEGGQYLN